MLMYYVMQVLEEGKAILVANNLPVPLIAEVKMSKKMTRALGICERKRNSLGSFTYTIKLNANAYTEQSDKFRNTILHELAHAAASKFDGSFDHGATWKMFMRVFGLEPNVKATSAEMKEIGYVKPQRLTRTLVQCRKCDMQHRATARQILILHACRCKCGGPLINLHTKVAPQ